MSFDDRKDAFENKFKFDAELKFKAEARAAKLFGLWVGGLLGLGEPQLTDYAKAMVAAQLESPGNEDILNKAEADLKAAGQAVVRAALEAKVQECEAKAMEQLRTEAAGS